MIAEINFEQVDALVVKPIWHTEIVAAAAMLTKYWAPNDRAKGRKKARLRGPFRRPISGPQNQPSIGKGTNCRSGNWPCFWGQIWCWKRLFSVCMCSLQWIRGVCICPASWPGVKNTIADLCAIFCKQSLLYVRSGDFSRLFCSMFLAVHCIYIYIHIYVHTTPTTTTLFLPTYKTHDKLFQKKIPWLCFF